MDLLLNFAIGMSAIFLFVSLFVTTIQEMVAQLLALRARYLRVGIVKLLERGQSEVGLFGARANSSEAVKAFFDHPLIKALESSRVGRTGGPSYVSKETFASVAVEISKLMANGTTPDAILKSANALDGPNATPLGKAIATFAMEAGGSLTKLRARLGSWFDESMERVGGAYKRWTQVATLIIGLAVAILLNVDSIGICRTLLSSPQQAALFAGEAEKILKSHPEFQDNAAFSRAVREKTSAAIDSAKLPIGWEGKGLASVSVWVVLGWILTALAASLGAAFWFDTLKRFVSIRAGGAKPSEKTGDK